MSSPFDASRASRVPFSFELYPPRSESSQEALHETVRHLAAAGPAFLSVTYGAGGSTGDARSTCCGSSASTPTSSPSPISRASATPMPGPRRSSGSSLTPGSSASSPSAAIRPRAGRSPSSATWRARLSSCSSSIASRPNVLRTRSPRSPAFPEPRWWPPAEGRHRGRGLPEGAPAGHAPHPGRGGSARQAGGGGDLRHHPALLPPGRLPRLRGASSSGRRHHPDPSRHHADHLTCPAGPGAGAHGEDLPSELSVALDVEPTAEGRREIGISWAARLAADVVAGGAPASTCTPSTSTRPS